MMKYINYIFNKLEIVLKKCSIMLMITIFIMRILMMNYSQLLAKDLIHGAVIHLL